MAYNLTSATMIFEKPVHNLVLLAAVAVLIVYLWEDERHTTHPPGVLVSSEPYQSPPTGTPGWNKGKYQILPRARFAMHARVLSTARYWFDGGSGISPIDFAVGWGPLSDQSVIDRISFYQSGRWWNYQPRDNQWPIPAAEIASHASNMHMIPASDAMLKALRSVRAGDLISLSGYLVDVQGEGGYRWSTSLSRSDTGGGACELVWVESLAVL
jgi:hypothetical protein